MYDQWMSAANRLLVMEEGDRGECDRIIGSRKTAVSITKRAQTLVLAARGPSNRQIALELGANEHVGRSSILLCMDFASPKNLSCIKNGANYTQLINCEMLQRAHTPLRRQHFICGCGYAALRLSAGPMPSDVYIV
jgi:hypothetical protein